MSRRVICVILLMALVLRALSFPARYEPRHSDEPGYLQSSLAVFEGIIPGFKSTPAGVQIWLGWGYVAVQSGLHFLNAPAEDRAAPMMIRPVLAMDRAVFETYRDLSSMRWFELICFNVVSILAVWAACRLGLRKTGIAGCVLVGGLAATLPLFVDDPNIARPYSLSWSLMILALNRANRLGETGKWAGTAILAGLAISCRVEMAALLPFVVAEYLRTPERRWRAILSCVGLSALVALAVAPWWVTALFGNLRSIIAVRVVGSTSISSLAPAMVEALWWNGLLVPFLLSIVALCRTLLLGPGLWMRLLGLYGILVILSMFKPTGYGFHQQGPAILIALIFAANGIAWILNRRTSARLAAAICSIGLLIPMFHTGRKILFYARNDSQSFAAQWIEENVPPGTRVYWGHGGFRTILPTPESAEVIWQELNGADAWRKKAQWGLGRLQRYGAGAENATAVDPPRLFSDDTLAKDRGHFRQWFVLGGHPDIQPRYDVRVLNGSESFGYLYESLEPELRKTGGYVVCRDAIRPAYLGEPVIKWTDSNGDGVYIHRVDPTTR